MIYRRGSKAFQFAEDPFVINTQGIGNFFHEVLLLLMFLQTKPQPKSMNWKFYDLFCTVLKNLTDKEIE